MIIRELTLQNFWNEQAEWSQKTFGTDQQKGPIGALKHLAKEAVEAQDDIGNLDELVDCLFLVCDATRRSGFTCKELLYAAFLKLEKNKKRVWPKPNFSTDEPVEHVRGIND